ncbi:peptidoglycan-binding protein [Limoniibacter endophyticus]|uniref:Peptidoglycan-binding protein n=1 Tax=Limoniibacter endophyticus TaxID=1565040 RepID=A0A8J3DNZ6_9HYPH|nr:peptidoglycan-binding protein [Limoniibacter endophyticus]GHC69444.1 peptidoglycan-binding protein [Limoniibacter endophyticus]
MARSAKPARRRKKKKNSPLIARMAGWVGNWIASHPVAVGGATALVVCLSFVSANAVWYQGQFHEDAFFRTRDNAHYKAPAITRQESLGRKNDATTFVIERPQEKREINPVERVQRVLTDLGLYNGSIDGLEGVSTREAVSRYQRIVGMPVSGKVDDALLSQLGIEHAAQRLASQPAAARPQQSIPPQPRQDPEAPARVQTVALPQERPQIRPNAAPTPPRDITQTASVRTDESLRRPQADLGGSAEQRIRKIQKGLRAFGAANIEVDGKMGAKTKNAIREFQSLFGLNETGEPSPDVLSKMREIGLVS